MERAQVLIGLDVGKTRHYAHVITSTGTVLFHRPVAQTEAALRTLLAEAGTYGKPVLVLDQCASIGALPRAVAHDVQVPVLYLPGRAFRHVADSFPGRTKTDRRDADIIATAGRPMSHAVRPLAPADPAVARIKVATGHLDALNADLCADKNRLRSLLLQLHAPLERLLGPRLGQAGVLPLLATWPTPAHLDAVPDEELVAFLKAQGSRRAATLVAELRQALTQQTLVLPGTEPLGEAIAYRAARCQAAVAEKHRVTAQLGSELAANATAQRILTMPGFGPTTTATVLAELDGKTFRSADHLASYAGVAPTVRQSGASRHVHRSRTANTRLKDALCWAAFTTIRSGAGKVAYEAKRHKGHWKAIIALARHRVSILYAMLRDQTAYREPLPPLTPT